MKIRSKCEWYEHGGQVRAIIYNDNETNDKTDINNRICYFLNYLYKEILSYSNANLETYLNTFLFSKLTKEKSETLDGVLTEKELLIALQSTENYKSPGNDGLTTKEFYIIFWN